MVFWRLFRRRRGGEEEFAEELTRELERRVREEERKLTPEARRRMKLALKHGAWRYLEKRIKKGEVLLVWRDSGDLYLDTRETFINFPFKRLRFRDGLEYVLLPTGLDAYTQQVPPVEFDWVVENASRWRPRPLCRLEWLEEWPEGLFYGPSYDGWDRTGYACKLIASDGRRFLAADLECIIVDEADGVKTAEKIAGRAAARHFELLWRLRLERELAEGKVSREEVKKIMDDMPRLAYLGLAVLKALNLLA